jgi:hypothetical protein
MAWTRKLTRRFSIHRPPIPRLPGIARRLGPDGIDRYREKYGVQLRPPYFRDRPGREFCRAVEFSLAVILTEVRIFEHGDAGRSRAVFVDPGSPAFAGAGKSRMTGRG